MTNEEKNKYREFILKVFGELQEEFAETYLTGSLIKHYDAYDDESPFWDLFDEKSCKKKATSLVLRNYHGSNCFYCEIYYDDGCPDVVYIRLTDRIQPVSVFFNHDKFKFTLENYILGGY